MFVSAKSSQQLLTHDCSSATSSRASGGINGATIALTLVNRQQSSSPKPIDQKNDNPRPFLTNLRIGPNSGKVQHSIQPLYASTL